MEQLDEEESDVVVLCFGGDQRWVGRKRDLIYKVAFFRGLLKTDCPSELCLQKSCKCAFQPILGFSQDVSRHLFLLLSTPTHRGELITLLGVAVLDTFTALAYLCVSDDLLFSFWKAVQSQWDDFTLEDKAVVYIAIILHEEIHPHAASPVHLTRAHDINDAQLAQLKMSHRLKTSEKLEFVAFYFRDMNVTFNSIDLAAVNHVQSDQSASTESNTE